MAMPNGSMREGRTATRHRRNKVTSSATPEAERPGRVIVVSIPDYSVTKFGKRYGSDSTVAEIIRFNQINKKISMERGVNYVDVTEVSRRAAQDSSLIASDGLHPSARMYAEWVELITPVALSALQTEK